MARSRHEPLRLTAPLTQARQGGAIVRGIAAAQAATTIASLNTDITRVFLTSSSFGGEFDIFPTAFSTDVDEVYRLFQFPIDAGSCILTVQGTALESSGFTGHIIFSPGEVPNPSAVPEPATWLMLMGGLAVIGFAMRRRGEGHGTPNVRFTMA